ncbi:hypothetical protein I4U23_015948 [Adineta vaga]|nr:hypothetical protein I4U23_015948 [Adineta vaga]
MSSNSTNSSSEKALVCVGFCPQVSLFQKAPKCFSSDSWVKLADGQRQNIGQLQPGEKILTYDSSNFLYSEMILMLHKSTRNEALFYTLQTKSNHTISLTGEHLIAVATEEGSMKYIAAKHVRTNRDSLYVIAANGMLIRSPVIQVTYEIKTGYAAPLTMTGTLFVNDVLASVFAHVYSHTAAQVAMTPVRWYYTGSKLMSLFSSNENKQSENIHDGMHWFAQAMFNYALQLYPSALDFEA